MPIESALELMIGFGSLIATIIFGILAVVNQDKKNNRLLLLTRTIIF
ncbi:putative holin-like toxin [Enterococcus thailandicus]|nr:putative holin-like toxin [Enterococcus thailandicus]MDA3974714.1 putative holin-like toxin [Enterococcus thailandicus]MDA3977200.1 putative holin-like toxin [Enterococcus thailandicus]MDA3982166.1 putative holin-like toxin [Enterococcus thailandicus]